MGNGQTVTARSGVTFAWDLPDLAWMERGLITVTARVNPALSSGSTFTNDAQITTSSEEQYQVTPLSNVASAPFSVTVSYGVDVTPDQTFVLAINNYRGGGGGGYDMFTEGTVLWKSMSEIRDYMAEYIASREILDPADYYVENWSLEPAGLYEQIGGPQALPESGSSAPADGAHVLMLTGGGLLVLGIFLLRRRAVALTRALRRFLERLGRLSGLLGPVLEGLLGRGPVLGSDKGDFGSLIRYFLRENLPAKDVIDGGFLVAVPHPPDAGKGLGPAAVNGL